MGIKRIDCCVETKPCVKPYPKLMKHKNLMIIGIFTDCVNYTVLVKNNGSYPVGTKRFISVDNTYLWEDYNEPLTLQNE